MTFKIKKKNCLDDLINSLYDFINGFKVWTLNAILLLFSTLIFFVIMLVENQIIQFN